MPNFGHSLKKRPNFVYLVVWDEEIDAVTQEQPARTWRWHRCPPQFHSPLFRFFVVLLFFNYEFSFSFHFSLFGLIRGVNQDFYQKSFRWNHFPLKKRENTFFSLFLSNFLLSSYPPSPFPFHFFLFHLFLHWTKQRKISFAFEFSIVKCFTWKIILHSKYFTSNQTEP